MLQLMLFEIKLYYNCCTVQYTALFCWNSTVKHTCIW